MKPLVFTFVFAYLLGICHAYKILLVPYIAEYNSRLMNMLKMADFLHEDGHDVSMLLHSRESHRLKNQNVKLEKIKIPNDVKLTPVQTTVKEGLKLDFFSKMKLSQLIEFLVDLEVPVCEIALKNRMHIKVKEQNFDLVIVDLYSVCLKILVEYIDSNVLQYSNFGFSSDYSNLFYPFIPSLTCGSELGAICTTQRPTTLNRLKNVLSVFGAMQLIKYTVTDVFQELRVKYNVNSSLSLHNFSKKTLLIATIDYALESPRPTMPHIIPISGLFLAYPKPLPDHLDKFMANSVKEGVILVSFGSIFGISNVLNVEMFVGVLSKLPQNVSASRYFSKLRKFTNWQLADCNRHINCNRQSPETELFRWV